MSVAIATPALPVSVDVKQRIAELLGKPAFELFEF
jgi:hypothetical protein